MTHAIPAASFLERLRSETAAAHKNLEQIPVSAAILSPSVTVADYARYLHAMQGVVFGLETHVHPKISSIIADLAQRKKAGDIQVDLAYIGASAENAENPFDVSGVSEAFALGIAYVVEGSALGGRFILKNINAVLGFDETRGASYFSGYGSKTGSMWKSFLEQMTSFASETASEQQIIDGANYAFEAIRKHLELHEDTRHLK